jgi:SEC-C motif-containing protein
MKKCFCGNEVPYSQCCAPFITGAGFADSPEKLMRSRYSAYVMAAVDYLYDTTHISRRALTSKIEIQQWAKSNSWKQLQIISAHDQAVEFKAHYQGRNGRLHVHHERSTFVQQEGRWYYLDGIFGEDINNSN